jgi:mycofactocin biosynthetic radical S-adenosylmethionine protein MftC
MPDRALAPVAAEPVEPVSLETVFLHVTKACNQRCGYCYFSAAQPLPDEMTAADLATFWPDVVRVGARKVVFTGGEPLLRPDLVSLIAALRDADPRHTVLRCLNTNGLLVTAALARSLVGLVDEIRVSIDALAARNDALRGGGSFDAAVGALACFYDAGFEPKALVTVTAESLPDLEDLLCLLAERRITQINLNPFRPIGRGASRPDLAVDAVTVDAAARRAWQRTHPGRTPPAAPAPAVEQHTCGVGRFLNILPNGDVFPCHVLTEPAFRCGNLRTERLLDICRADATLGRLRRLDFTDVASAEPALRELTQPGACLGDVVAAAGGGRRFPLSLLSRASARAASR